MKIALIVSLVCGLAATAGASQDDPVLRRLPRPRIHMGHDSNGGLMVVVEGILRPDVKDLVVYPEGHPGEGVHPYSMGPDGDRNRSISVAIVYRASSSDLVDAVGSALEVLHLERYLAPDSEVSVVEYGQTIKVRMARSNVANLSSATFHGSAIGTAATREGALREVRNLLEHSTLQRRIVLVVGDDCSNADEMLRELARQKFEIYHLLVDSKGKCPFFPRVGRGTRIGAEELVDALQTLVLEATGMRWVAMFDASWLGAQTGARHIVLDIAGRKPESVVVGFPESAVVVVPAAKVEPSWWSSPLRQLGLGALLVGLIALVVGWRFRARAR